MLVLLVLLGGAAFPSSSLWMALLSFPPLLGGAAYVVQGTRDYRLDNEGHVKVVKKTQEEHRPSAGDIADLAALPRDSGDVKALDWITAGSQPGHVEFQKFFRQAHEANGPTAKRLSSSPPSTFARMLGVSFELPYMGHPFRRRSSAAEGQRRPARLGFSLLRERVGHRAGSQRTASRIFFRSEACCDGPARCASGRKCPLGVASSSMP